MMKMLFATVILSTALTIVTAQQTTTFTTIQTKAPVLLLREFTPPTPPTHTGPSRAAATETTTNASQTTEVAHGVGHATGPVVTCTPTIAPDKNGYVPPSECNALYNYYPSFGAAIAAASIFGMLSIIHIGQAIWHKKAFCWVIIMGVLWETAAYGARVAGTRNQQNVGELLTFQIFVLLAPLWVNAFDYMVLGRMIHFFLPTHSVFGIRASTLSIYFVLLDIVSFIIQLYGTTMTSSTAPIATIMKGTHIYMGGIGLQEFFIIVFLGFGIKFHNTMLRLERIGQLPFEKRNWRRLLYSLYASLGFITVRIIFRLVEFSAGNTSSNPLPYHEAYFYVFDAIPMSCAITVMCITHPGSILQGPDSNFPKSQCCAKRAEKKAIKREEKALHKQALIESKRAEKQRKKAKKNTGYMEMLSQQEMNAGMRP